MCAKCLVATEYIKSFALKVITALCLILKSISNLII